MAIKNQANKKENLAKIPKKITIIPQKILNRVYKTSYLYRTEVEKETFDFNGFSFEPLDIDLLNKMARNYKTEISSEKYDILKRRIDPIFPDKTFVLLDKEKNIYGFFSMCFGNHKEDFLKIFIPAKVERVYVFDIYVFESKRGSGVQRYMFNYSINIAKERGYEYATCIVAKGNKASETNALRAGFQRSGHIRHFFMGKKVISKVHEWDENRIQKINQRISKNINMKIKST